MVFLRICFLAPFVISLSVLAGCSSNFKSVVDSAKAIIHSDNAITPEYIASLPYASLLVTVNDTRPLLLILAFVDHDPLTNTYRLTWLTQDAGSIVTENGRIIHTTGFTKDNLESLMPIVPSHSSASVLYPALGSSPSWQAQYDWSPGYRYGFTAQVTSRSLGMDTVITDLWQQKAEKIQETVVFDDSNAQFSNLFWLTPATETADPFVIKSIQYLGPNMDKVDMLMVKPFVPPRSVAATKNTPEKKAKDLPL